MHNIPGRLFGLHCTSPRPLSRWQNADVRKAVVFALVDMYMVLGPRFEDHLGELNASQLRLVRIYINRMTQARVAREAAAHGLDAAQQPPNYEGAS